MTDVLVRPGRDPRYAQAREKVTEDTAKKSTIWKPRERPQKKPNLLTL